MTTTTTTTPGPATLPEPASATSSGKLERDAARGVRWTGAAHAARQALQLITSLALTRMLLPEDFGLAAFVLIVVAFIELVQDLGLTAALVQRRTVGQRLISTVFWFQMGIGAVAAAVVWLAAPVLAALAGNGRLAPLLGAASIMIMVRGLTLLPRAELSRRLDFATLGRAELLAALAGVVFVIGAALAGAGVWSLVLQPVIGSALLALLLWPHSTWRPRVEFSWRALGRVRRFSGYLAAHNILDFFNFYGAHLLIAYHLPETRLGIYYLALRVTTFPATAVAASISRVLFPYLTQVIDNLEHVRKSYLSIACAIGLFVFPAVVGFALVADLFFEVISGAAWSDCATVAILLTPVGLGRAIATTTGPLYQALGRTDLMFRWGRYYVAVALTAFAIGVHWDIVGVASAYSLSVLFAYPLFAVPLSLIGVRMRDLFGALAKPLALCAAMTAIVLLLRAATSPWLSPALLLTLSITVGAASYIALAWTVARGELISILRRTRARSA